MKEAWETVLVYADLPVVDEPDDVFQNRELDPAEVDERLGVRITEEDGPQLWAGGCQHHLVSLELLVLTGQTDVVELILLLDRLD